MKSRSARFLTSLLKSNLISTAMVLSVSSSDMTKLTRPFMGSLTTSMLPSDLLWTNKLLNGIYNNLRTSMIKAGNVAIKEPANLFVAYFVKLRTLWEQKDSFQISSTEVLVFSQEINMQCSWSDYRNEYLDLQPARCAAHRDKATSKWSCSYWSFRCHLKSWERWLFIWRSCCENSQDDKELCRI